MPVSIRTAALQDVPGILAMERQSPSAAHWAEEQYNKRVSSGVVLVAENAAEHDPAPGKNRQEQGALCGFICAQVVAGEWEIENVVVAGEFLRRGVADELMRELIRRAQGEAGAILLEVRESNRAGRGLYEKHGFREMGRRRAYYSDPAEDAILYTLRWEG